MESDQLLVVDRVVTYYGQVPALRGATLDISPGEIVSVIGPNGAGKTTLVKTILGALKPRSGLITFRGEAIQGLTDRFWANGPGCFVAALLAMTARKGPVPTGLSPRPR